jgi:hypothetical protein
MKKLAKQSALCLDTSKKESEGHIGHQEESDLFIPFDEIRISPCLSFALEKKVSAL